MNSVTKDVRYFGDCGTGFGIGCCGGGFAGGCCGGVWGGRGWPPVGASVGFVGMVEGS